MNLICTVWLKYIEINGVNTKGDKQIMHSYHSNLSSLYLVKHFGIDCLWHKQPSDTVPNWLLLFNTGIHHLPVLLLNSPQTSAQSHPAVQSSAFMALSIKRLLISKSECRQTPGVSFGRFWDSKCARISQVKIYLKIYAALFFLLFFFQLLIDTIVNRWNEQMPLYIVS